MADNPPVLPGTYRYLNEEQKHGLWQETEKEKDRQPQAEEKKTAQPP